MTWVEGMVVGVVLLVLAGVGTDAYVQVHSQRACLERGFPSAKIAFPLTVYCIKRVNQTDSVVALKSLR